MEWITGPRRRVLLVRSAEVGAVALVILFTDFLHFYVFGRSYISEYVLSSNLPLKLAGIEPWRAGHFPTWNSRLAAGWPVLADAASMPLDWRNVFYFFLPPVPAYWLSLFVSRLIGACFLFYYLRLQHRVRFAAALPATFVYFCGTLLIDDSRASGGATWDLWPAYLWACELLYRQITARRVAAIAALWFFMFTMGSFGVMIYIAPIGGLWIFGLFLAERARDAWRFLRVTAAFIGAHALGVAMTAISLLPFIELVQNSNRGDEYPADLFALRSIFFALFGPHDQYNPVFPTYSFFIYVGVIAVPLLLATWQRRDGPYERALFWLSVVVLGVILAFTTQLKSLLVPYVPFLATIGSLRIAPFWGFLAAVTVALALNRGEWRPTRLTRAVAGSLFAAQAAVLVVIVLAAALWGIDLDEVPEKLASAPAAAALLTPFIAASFLVLVAIRALGLGLSLRSGGAGVSNALGAALLLELTATMAIARPSTQVSQYYPVTPEVAYLQRHLDANSRVLQVYPFIMHDWDGYTTLLFDAALVHGLDSANIYNSLIVREYSDLFADFGDVAQRKALFRRGYNQNMTTNRATSPLLDALGVRFVIASEPLADTTRLIERLRGQDYVVYERTDAMPRAFFVSKAEVMDQAEIHDRLRRIAAAAFTQQQLRRYVMLDRSTVAEPPPGSAPPPPVPAEPERFVPARIVRDADTVVDVEVDAPSDGWLVLSDTYYPGWRAQVDGRPAPVLRANGFARAVAVHAGHQQVIFRYDPDDVRYGAWISAAGALVTIWLAFAAGRGRPRGRLASDRS